MGQVRVAKTGNNVEVRSQSLKMAKFLRGELTVDDMDDDELARGQFKDKRGRFGGRPPSVVPREFFAACQRELMRRGSQKMAEHFLGAIDTIAVVMNDTETSPETRIKAANIIIERVAGKTPDKVEISGDSPWQVIIDRIVTPAGESPPVTIPGEVVEG